MYTFPNFFIVLLLCGTAIAIKTDKMVNCYYSTWPHGNHFTMRLEPKDIDPYLCTHLSYAFLGIDDGGRLDVADDIKYGFLNQTLALKWQNPSLKIVAVVGGPRISSTRFSQLVGSETQRSIFKYSVAALFLQLGFEGLDLHWLYPGSNGVLKDPENFVTLLKELRATLNPLELEFGITVSGSIEYTKEWYNIAEIVKYVDFINIMTYNYTDGNRVAYDAPLYGEGQDNVDATINFWIDVGAPASKLNMGIALTARTFILWDAEKIRTDTAIDVAWPFSDIDPQYKTYGEFCHMEYADLMYNTSFGFDVELGASFVQDDVSWTAYESPRALEVKLEYLLTKELRGVMVWSLQNDDYLGTCSEKYPLLKLINRKLDHRYVCQPGMCCIKSIRTRTYCFYID
ncbi:chitinase-3-like protein 1 [Haematobia irritans]|uniref:chitinase-3-like protein 1 n=1 Tax=Haematobia irritans TaxID=7368 RepID=UPI003F508785